MFTRSALSAAAIGGLFALSSCGSDDDKSKEPEASATPAQAIAEIAAVRTALGQAVDQAKAGDKSAADDTVSEAYLQHFEKVEGPLEERDHELNEELEESISQELRDKIKTASTTDVEALVKEIEGDLATAEAKLK
jgi:hypothetical protein